MCSTMSWHSICETGRSFSRTFFTARSGMDKKTHACSFGERWFIQFPRHLQDERIWLNYIIQISGGIILVIFVVIFSLPLSPCTDAYLYTVTVEKIATIVTQMTQLLGNQANLFVLSISGWRSQNNQKATPIRSQNEVLRSHNRALQNQSWGD